MFLEFVQNKVIYAREVTDRTLFNLVERASFEARRAPIFLFFAVSIWLF